MRNPRQARSRFVAAALATVLLVLPIGPAFAADGDVPPAPTIVSGVVVGGVDLSGLTAEAAAATLTAGIATPTLAPISVKSKGGHTFTLAAVGAVDPDIAGLVQEALAATQPVTIEARYTVDTTVVATFAKVTIAKHVDRTSASARRTIVKRRLKLTPSRLGYKTDVTATAASLRLALAKELAAGGAAQPVVTATVKTLNPKYTSKNIGKTIVVVLRERRVYLYSGAKIQRKYGCAIGMPGHETPTGHFKVIRKALHPTWRNPGSGWAKGMPSHIDPGPNNPLGLRALYLNVSGIRIHGTAKTSSIGHAASHGCIRLTNHNIVKLYPLVKVGTQVYIVK